MTFKYGPSTTGLLLKVTAAARERREFWLSLGQHSQVVISCNFITLNTLRPAWTHKATLPTELESDNDVSEKYRRHVCRCRRLIFPKDILPNWKCWQVEIQRYHTRCPFPFQTCSRPHKHTWILRLLWWIESTEIKNNHHHRFFEHLSCDSFHHQLGAP